jgi:NitT/TauT family transport system substrate-binding protein
VRLISKLRYCLVAAIPVVALAACSSGSSSSAVGSSSGVATGPAPEVSTITLDAVPTADAAGLFIAQDDGYFARQGLKVNIVPINGGEYGMGNLQTGKAQLVEGNYVSFILAQVAGKFAAPNPTNPAAPPEPSKPIDMRMIADTSQMQAGNQALYVMPNSPYKTVQALVKAHAQVGVNTLHNIGSVLLGSLLASHGDKLSTLKQVPEILPNMPGLLEQHKIPAAWLPEPFGTVAEQDYGAVPLADFDQGSLENFPIGTIVGDTSWIQSHPNTVAAFLRAFREGQRIADTNRSAVQQALVTNKVAPTAEIAATMTIDTYPLVMDVPVMQRVSDAMYEFGVINKPYKITGMIQPESGEIGGQ